MISVSEIKDHECEICGAGSLCVIVDKGYNLRYSCFNDVVQLWRRIIAE